MVISRIRVEFKDSCLKQSKIIKTPRNIVNSVIVYEWDTLSRDLNSVFTLKDCLFGAVKLTKNVAPDKFSYSGYGSGFYSRSFFLFPSFVWGKNVVIFGVDNSSSVHTDNKTKYLTETIVFYLLLQQKYIYSK